MMIWWSALTILAKDSASESALRTMELDPPNIRYLHQASPSSEGEAAEKSPGRGFSGSRKRSAMVVTKVFLAASQSVTNALRSKVTDWLPQSVRTNRPFISEVLRRYPAFSALRPPASSRRTCGVRQIAYPMMTGPSLVVASLSIHLDPLWRDRWFCREADFPRRGRSVLAQALAGGSSDCRVRRYPPIPTSDRTRSLNPVYSRTRSLPDVYDSSRNSAAILYAVALPMPSCLAA